ncbi:MAG: hypothetical protein H7Z40_16955 [Phycisphaerae bacterium]|nr:hypothetical protein [Gemmatimonadaceae bacterium]
MTLQRAWKIALVATAAALFTQTAVAQPHCPTAALRAYAHNDYNNTHPLYDAVAFGYRGVEADVYLVDGVLRVAHDRKSATGAPALDTLYLIPIRDLLARCGPTIVAGAMQPFLLNLEIKEASNETLQVLLTSLSSVADLMRSSTGQALEARLIVTLVGYAGTDRPPHLVTFPGVACKANTPARLVHCVNTPGTAMVSVDYGKTQGRWWTLDAERVRWLAALRAAQAASPNLMIRVFNVPSHRETYLELLHAGVDLIGTKDLAGTAALLATKGR